MPSGVELSLSSLLPTVSPLPDELIALATSLLAQSRTKAATLKPDEEVGRTYACCHIACQRLGHRLALEIAKPTPPVKPKAYSKLHTYLNSVLKTTITPRRGRVRPVGQSTPLKTLGSPNRKGKPAQVQARSVPTRASPGEQRTPVTTPTSTPRKRKAENQEIDHDEQTERTTKEIIANVLDDQPGEPEDEAADSDDLRRTVAKKKRPAKTPLRRKEKHDAADDDALGPAGLLPGLGTMFQPAVDWLSDDRREDYARWKRSILREAALVEQHG